MSRKSFVQAQSRFQKHCLSARKRSDSGKCFLRESVATAAIMPRHNDSTKKGQRHMHLHKYEKYWLVFGVTTLVAFLIILGIGAFHQGSHPNNGKKH